MDLEQLVRVIEEIRERAAKYKELLVQNEAQTRVSLIDPLLRTVGWPLEDPAWVQVEVKTKSGGKVDYVLYGGDGQPAILLEAKSLGAKLEPAASAAVGYAWDLGQAGKVPRYVGVSDGLRWVIAEPHNLKSPSCQVNFGNTQERIEDLLLRFVQVLWKRQWDNAREATKNPESPLLGTQPTSLAIFKPQRGQKPPQVVVLPDGTEREPKTAAGRSWRGFLITLAEWLVQNKKLTVEHVPIPVCDGCSTYIVHREPRHATGKGFENKVQLSNGLWLDTFVGPVEAVTRARRLCHVLGVDPSQIALVL